MTTSQESDAVSNTALPSLEPFNRDPFLRWVRQSRYNSPWLVLAIFPVVLLALSAVTAIQGAFAVPGGWRTVERDFSVLLRLRDAGQTMLAFPLLRDYPTLLAIFFQTWNIMFIYRQWLLMERFIPHLETYGLAAIDSERRATVAARINKVNHGLGRHGKLLAVAAAVFTAGVVSPEVSVGIFWQLAPDQLTGSALNDWTHRAYTGWWANATNPVGFLTYCFIVWSVWYYMLVQNHVGIGILWGVFRHQKRNLKYCLNLANPDGRYGWGLLRQILWTVYLSLFVNACTIAVTFVIVPLPRLWGAVIALTILFAVGTYYFIEPLRLLVFSLVEFRRTWTATLQKRIMDLSSRNPSLESSSTGELIEIQALRQELAHGRGLPVLPFSLRATFVFVFVTAIPAAGSLIQLLSAISER